MDSISTYTASEARKKLYSLIRSAGKGLRSYEIKLRGSGPVVLIGKNELESWLETLDIYNSPNEAKAIRKAKKERSTVSHKELLKEIGLES